MTDLFNPRTINKLYHDVILTEEQKKNAKKWLKLLKDEKLSEEQNNYMSFANIILEGILGYPINNNNIFTNEKNNVEFQCKLTNNKTVCIEVKEIKTANLFQRQNYSKKEQSTLIKQLWELCFLIIQSRLKSQLKKIGIANLASILCLRKSMMTSDTSHVASSMFYI